MNMEVDFFKEVFTNKVLMTTVVSWAVAQTVKVLLGILRERRFNFKWFIGVGGMPSSHASGMASLAASVGFICGFNSYQFAIATVIALIVMFDAQGVRRTVGIQAEILNKIMDDLYWKGKVEEERLRELLGHTPVEVIAGAVLGILISIISFKT